jgi:hypothetical protein
MTTEKFSQFIPKPSLTASDKVVGLTNTSSSQVNTAVINSGGTGYSVSDLLTINGGSGTQAILQVTNVSLGVITAISIQNPGSYSVTPIPIAAAVTGGTGSGATFNLTFTAMQDNAIFDGISLSRQGAYNLGSGINQIQGDDWENKSFAQGIETLVINTPGSGYAVGDFVSLFGGTSNFSSDIRINTIGVGGSVTQFGVYSRGSYTVIPGTNNVPTSTLSGGTGLTFDVTYSSANVTRTADYGLYQNGSILINRTDESQVVCLSMSSDHLNQGMEIPTLNDNGKAYIQYKHSQSPIAANVFAWDFIAQRPTIFHNGSFRFLGYGDVEEIDNAGLSGVTLVQNGTPDPSGKVFLNSIFGIQNISATLNGISHAVEVRTRNFSDANPLQFNSDEVEQNGTQAYLGPTLSGANEVADTIHGFRFTLSMDRVVTGAQYPVNYMNSAGTRLIQIYRVSDQQLIFSGRISNTNPNIGNFYTNTNVTPCYLKAGVSYVVSVVVPAGDEYDNAQRPASPSPFITITGFAVNPVSSIPQYPQTIVPVADIMSSGGFLSVAATSLQYRKNNIGKNLILTNQNLEYNTLLDSSFVGDSIKMFAAEAITAGDVLKSSTTTNCQVEVLKSTDSSLTPILGTALANASVGEAVDIVGMELITVVLNSVVTPGTSLQKSNTVNGRVEAFTNASPFAVSLQSGTVGQAILAARDRSQVFSADPGTYGEIYFTNNATATVISVINTPVKVVGNYTSGLLAQFTHVALSGTLVKTSTTATCRISYSASVTMNLLSDSVSFYIYINGVQNIKSKQTVFLGSPSQAMHNISGQTVVALNVSDTIELRVENNDSVNNIIVSNLNILASKVA